MRKFLLLLGLLALILVSFPLWGHHLGKWLLVEDDLQPADVICVLRGDPFYRFHKGVELYRQGYGDKILVSMVPEKQEELWDFHNFERVIAGGEALSEIEYAKRIFQYFGQGEKDVYFTDTPVTSTFDEAQATKTWMLENNENSLILVTSTYHMRRALMIFKAVFKGTGIQIYPVTARHPLYQPDHWWRQERDVKRVMLEYGSMVFNFLYHFVFQKIRTPFDTV